MRIDGQHIRETMSGAVGGDRRVAETPPGGTADTAATGSTTGGVGSGQPVESQSTARSGAAAPGLGGEGAPGGGVAGASHTNSAELGALLDRARQTPEVRQERIHQVRERLASGEYMTSEAVEATAAAILGLL
ncbi:MAG: flagellar biosynthesis anti-sigma factor FlgM [Planctomycetales bacterium]|nr:flagellar biosynthesis anti-sigma factor FlgM [Planctomycetales bacterium]